MQINSVLGGLPDATSLAKGRTSAAVSAASASVAGAPPTVLNSNSAAVRAILAKYDVTDITPNEFSQMVQSLYSAGALSAKNLQDLGGIRTDLLASGVGADDSLNLVDYYSDKIADAKSQMTAATPAAQQQQLAPLVQRLDWVEKFQTLKDEPQGGVSALA
ncbi:MAG: hypothetical protein ACLQLG_05030 [Thermoguttaceae bacterium]